MKKTYIPFVRDCVKAFLRESAKRPSVASNIPVKTLRSNVFHESGDSVKAVVGTRGQLDPQAVAEFVKALEVQEVVKGCSSVY